MRGRREPVNVVLATNDAYGLYCATAVRSLLAAAAEPSAYVIHVLTTGLSSRAFGIMDRVARSHQALLKIHEIELGDVGKLPTLKHISADTYSRILAPDLLPKVDRFIYLDCDVVVTDDLTPLHDSDMHGAVVAGVVHRNANFAAEFVARHGLSAPVDYVNAGVLLIDAAAWRREAATPAVIDWVTRNQSIVAFADQCAINHHFRNRIHLIHPRWNVEARHYRERLNGVVFDADMQAAMQDPAVIHYTGPIKPWMFVDYVPRREVFLSHLRAVVDAADIPRTSLADRLRNAARIATGSARFRAGRLLRQLGLRRG